MAKKQLPEFAEYFRKNLKILRKKANLTQEELAKKISEDKYGSYIANIESGQNMPSPEGMTDIAKALGISLDVLCGNNPKLSYRDIARSLMLLYFLDDAEISCEEMDDYFEKHIVTIKIKHGDLRQFMYQFDGRFNDRTNPQEFLDWLDEQLEKLDAISPWEKKNSHRWDIFVRKMTRRYVGKKRDITEPEVKEKFFGGRDNAKLQAQDNKSGEEPL